MNQLIKVTTNEKGQQLVSARELYSFLEPTERFQSWFDRQLQYGFEENKDYIGCKEFNTLANQELMNYAIKIDMAKEISMIQRTEKGKQARLYFIECEKKLLQNQLPSYQIEDPIERAERWIIEQKETRALENKVENLSTALDSLHDWVSILKVANLNNVNEKVFKWRLLKKQSDEMGFLIKKAASPRYGYQNLYHINVFKSIYPDYNYNFDVNK